MKPKVVGQQELLDRLLPVLMRTPIGQSILRNVLWELLAQDAPYPVENCVQINTKTFPNAVALYYAIRETDELFCSCPDCARMQLGTPSWEGDLRFAKRAPGIIRDGTLARQFYYRASLPSPQELARELYSVPPSKDELRFSEELSVPSPLAFLAEGAFDPLPEVPESIPVLPPVLAAQATGAAFDMLSEDDKAVTNGTYIIYKGKLGVYFVYMERATLPTKLFSFSSPSTYEHSAADFRCEHPSFELDLTQGWRYKDFP